MKCTVKNCEKEAAARGLCHKHYKRKRLYGDTSVVRLKQHHGLTLKERFLAYAEPKPDFRKKGICWEWIGYKDPRGYGRLNVNGRPVPAHRISWEIHYGPIPVGRCVLHHCDNPACIRPSHLFLGTQTDNLHDMYQKGRDHYGISIGEAHGLHKLTESQVLEIRGSPKRCADLAFQYRVSRATIWAILNRKTWKHI